MISSLWKTSDSLDHQLPSRNNDDSLTSRLGLRTVLVFCSSRAWRCGPRLLMQILAFILTILVLLQLLPEHLVGGSYKNILTWSSSSDYATDLRIVVFGSPDLAGSAPDGSGRRKTWTEQLCEEMGCSSHLSLVPNGDNSHGLTSNGIYAEELKALQNITAETDIVEKPASDYLYIAEQYPVPSETPDLEAQVDQFLGLSPPKNAPRETLWVFTFGTWDIWNLAAMPRDSGEHVVDALALHMFEQIERLYMASLNPRSVAYSDFWSNASEATINELTAPDAAAKVDGRKLENFRVVLPKLFDMTLVPGWRNRPVPPYPQSLSEQMRKAVALTKRWNLAIEFELESWKELAGSRPEKMLEEEEDPIVEIPKSSWLLQYLPASLRPSRKGVDEEGEPVIYAPYPRRSGHLSDQARGILDVMTEGEMQRSGVWDSRGRGFLSVNDSMRFLDVWEPCITGYTEDLSVDMEESSQECEVPDDHLFYDAFTINKRAIEGLSKGIAEGVVDELFLRDERGSGWFYRRSVAQTMAQKPAMAVRKVQR